MNNTKNLPSEEEVIARESAAVDAFKLEFDALVVKHGVKAICIGTRPESEPYLDPEDGKEARNCLWFVASKMVKPTLNELRMLSKAKDEVENLIKKAAISVFLGGGKCNCENCRKEADEETTAPTEVENAAK